MRGFRKNLRKVDRKRVGWVGAGLAILVAGLFFAVATTQKSNASASVSSHHAVAADGSWSWTGQGSDACKPGTTGNVLWIFNPHSDAKPVSLTVTWSTGQKITYIGGWDQSGNSQDWHLTVDIVGAFPPQSASVSYTGTIGDNPILTISGCNESTTTTTTTGTTTGETTTVTIPVTTTATSPSTTVTQPSTTVTSPGGTTTVTNTVTGPTQTVTSPTQTVTVTQTGPTTTVTHTVTVIKQGKPKVIVQKKVIIHVKTVKPAIPKHPKPAYTP